MEPIWLIPTGLAEKSAEFPGFLGTLAGLTVLLAEAVDSSGGVNQALLARVERMALVANIDGQLLASRACLERVTARTLNGNGLVLWMNAFLHGAFYPRVSVFGEADLSARSPMQQPAHCGIRRKGGRAEGFSGGLPLETAAPTGVLKCLPIFRPSCAPVSPPETDLMPG